MALLTITRAFLFGAARRRPTRAFVGSSRRLQGAELTSGNRIVIVGGGTAGWLTAAYLAKRLGADRPEGAKITLIEAPDIATIGVGEGTFPTIRSTLAELGVSEARFLREEFGDLQAGRPLRGLGAAFAKWEVFRILSSVQPAAPAQWSRFVALLAAGPSSRAGPCRSPTR